MKAFLLSAGLGTRLRPLTNKIPKCLVPINGVPLLYIWLDHLQKHGIKKVLVNTHWLPQKVENAILAYGDEKQDEGNSICVETFFERELLGSAGTLMEKKNWVDDKKPFLILYGDNLTNVNLGRLINYHKSHDFPLTLGVFKTKSPERCGIVHFDENYVVKEFIEKPEDPKTNTAAAGIYIADYRIFDFFPNKVEKGEPLDLGYHILPKMIGKMKAFVIEDFLMDIGTPESYKRAQIIFKKTSILKINKHKQGRVNEMA